MILREYVKTRLVDNYAFFRRVQFFVDMMVGRKMDVIVNCAGESYTDGKVVVISAPKQILDDEKLNNMFKDKPEAMKTLHLALALHEAEHVNASNFKQFVKFQETVGQDYKTFYGIKEKTGRDIGRFLANAIEDGRIERRAMNRLPGTEKFFKLSNFMLFHDSKCMDDEYIDLLNNVLIVSKTQRYLSGTKEKYHGKELYKILEKIQPLIIKAVNSNSTTEMFNLSYQVHKTMMHYIASLIEEENNDGQAGPENKGFGGGNREDVIRDMADSIEDINEHMNNDKTDLTPKDIQIDVSVGEETTSEQNKENEIALDKDKIKNDNFIDKLMKIIDEEEKAEKEQETVREKKKEKEDLKTKESQPTDEEIRQFAPTSSYKIIDSRKELKAPASSYIVHEAKKLRKDLIRIIQEKKQERMTRERRGMINRNRLTNLVAEKSDRVFIRKEKDSIEDIAFYIVIDMSGSMFGEKIESAFRCAAVLEEALRGIAKVKIITFNTDCMTNIYVLKEFDRENEYSVMYNNLYANGGNCDPFALSFAETELLKRKEQRKFLIMITDGLPSCAMNTSNAENETADIARRIKKKLPLITIAIDENESSKEKFIKLYKDNIVFRSHDKLSAELSKIVKAAVK